MVFRLMERLADASESRRLPARVVPGGATVVDSPFGEPAVGRASLSDAEQLARHPCRVPHGTQTGLGLQAVLSKAGCAWTGDLRRTGGKPWALVPQLEHADLRVRPALRAARAIARSQLLTIRHPRIGACRIDTGTRCAAGALRRTPGPRHRLPLLVSVSVSANFRQTSTNWSSTARIKPDANSRLRNAGTRP